MSLEEIKTQTCTEGRPCEDREQMANCKLTKEASEETKLANILILNV